MNALVRIVTATAASVRMSNDIHDFSWKLKGVIHAFREKVLHTNKVIIFDAHCESDNQTSPCAILYENVYFFKKNFVATLPFIMLKLMKLL